MSFIDRPHAHMSNTNIYNSLLVVSWACAAPTHTMRQAGVMGYRHIADDNDARYGHIADDNDVRYRNIADDNYVPIMTTGE